MLAGDAASGSKMEAPLLRKTSATLTVDGAIKPPTEDQPLTARTDTALRPAVPSISLTPTSSRLGKAANHARQLAQQASPSKLTTSFLPAGFNLPRPKDDKEVERMYIELMHKRGWQSLPDAAKRQMLAYPPAKKWALVHQDKLTEWQGEQKRLRQSKQADVPLARRDEEGSPEWYVKQIVDNTITSKQLLGLSVCLRIQPILWVRAFIQAQGPIALTNALMNIDRKEPAGGAPHHVLSDKELLDKEYDIMKCFKTLMNNKFGADDALAHQSVLIALITCLTSSGLPTRKLVSEILTFLCYYEESSGHTKVLQALDSVKSMVGGNGRFDAWMRLCEDTIDGRGRMGKLGCASDELRKDGLGMKNLLTEYALATLILVNTIVNALEHDLHLRYSIRNQFHSCGIKRILTKMEIFGFNLIDRQVEKFRENEIIDYEDMLQRKSWSHVDVVEPEVKDLTDPKEEMEVIEASKQELGHYAKTYGTTIIKDNGQAVVGDVSYHTHYHYADHQCRDISVAPSEQQLQTSMSLFSAASKYGIQVPDIPLQGNQDRVVRWVQEVYNANTCATSIWDGEEAPRPPSVGTSLDCLDGKV